MFILVGSLDNVKLTQKIAFSTDQPHGNKIMACNYVYNNLTVLELLP